MFVRPHHQYPLEQYERLPSYLEVCLSTGQPHSLQEEVKNQSQMGLIELNAQAHVFMPELPPMFPNDQDIPELVVSPVFVGRQSHQQALSNLAPRQSKQSSRLVTPNESERSATCFSGIHAPSQKRINVIKDDVVYQMSAAGPCQQVGSQDDEEWAYRRSEYENSKCAYTDSESCRDNLGQHFHTPIREGSGDCSEIPSFPRRRGWYDPDDKYSRSTIEFTRSWPRDKLLTAFWSLPKRSTYGQGRSRLNETNWDVPEPRIGDFPSEKAYRAAHSRWSHLRAEQDRRCRHFVIQTDTAISTPEMAYVLADSDPVLQARRRSAKSRDAESSKMPGKDDQLLGSAYMHRFSAVVVHSEHEGRVIAEARAEKLEAEIQNLQRQLTLNNCNEYKERHCHLTLTSSPTKKRKVDNSAFGITPSFEDSSRIVTFRDSNDIPASLAIDKAPDLSVTAFSSDGRKGRHGEDGRVGKF